MTVEERASYQAAADRFDGFADLYDEVRPVPPRELGDVLSRYSRPSRLVVDLGSGTGLSTRWVATWASHVVGVEPNDTMRSRAEAIGGERIDYRRGWSHETGLPDGCADIVVIVQALHWMDPTPTFAEIARVLRPGGVFAAIDCDWPPTVADALAERAWVTCRRNIKEFESRLTGGVAKWSKSTHLERMIASGEFEWCREIALTSIEHGNAERFISLLKSQGDYQALGRHGVDDSTLGVDQFARLINSRLGARTRRWYFTYRVRLAFKA